MIYLTVKGNPVLESSEQKLTCIKQANLAVSSIYKAERISGQPLPKALQGFIALLFGVRREVKASLQLQPMSETVEMRLELFKEKWGPEIKQIKGLCSKKSALCDAG
jgi:hypothetical protein